MLELLKGGKSKARRGRGSISIETTDAFRGLERAHLFGENEKGVA